MKLSNRVTTTLALLLCIVTLFTLTTSAAYYNTYTTIATLGNANGCNAAQGFATGSTYTYSLKINGDETKAVIYRTKMSDGSTTLMTNGDNGTTYCTYLGHANDMTLANHDGVLFMFIVTMKAGSMSFVKLKYVGTTYYKVGNYTIKLDGANKSMSGVAKTATTSTAFEFLFKSGKTVYKGSVGLTTNSGTINVTKAFTCNTVDALVNGKKVANISEFSNQGFCYHNNKIYYPLTKGNVSIVLVYNNVLNISGTAYADDNLSFRITSSAYPDLFEIESVGISGGKLWFSTNRRTAPGDTAHDGVHYFNGFSP